MNEVARSFGCKPIVGAVVRKGLDICRVEMHRRLKPFLLRRDIRCTTRARESEEERQIERE